MDGSCGTLVQQYRTQLVAGDPSQQAAPALASRLKEVSDLTIVQLPLAPTELKADATDAQKWAFLLHRSQEFTFESLPAPLREGPFLAAAQSARIDAMSEAERATLDLQLNVMRQYCSLDNAVAEVDAALLAAVAEREAALAGKAAAEAALAADWLKWRP